MSTLLNTYSQHVTLGTRGKQKLQMQHNEVNSLNSGIVGIISASVLGRAGEFEEMIFFKSN